MPVAATSTPPPRDFATARNGLMMALAERSIILGPDLSPGGTRCPSLHDSLAASYDTFGDENTNELVGLLNTMDATYLAELRALHETNFARFDAKLEQRVAELRTEIAELRGEMRTSIAELRGEMTAGFERIGKEVARANVVALRWFVALAVTTLVTVAAAVLGMVSAS